MKLLTKKNTSTTLTIKEAFPRGTKVSWTVPFFDGRMTQFDAYSGTVVKVNKVTVDVILDSTGDLVRLDAYKKISTGKWTLN